MLVLCLTWKAGMGYHGKALYDIIDICARTLLDRATALCQSETVTNLGGIPPKMVANTCLHRQGKELANTQTRPLSVSVRKPSLVSRVHYGWKIGL